MLLYLSCSPDEVESPTEDAQQIDGGNCVQIVVMIPNRREEYEQGTTVTQHIMLWDRSERKNQDQRTKIGSR